MALKKQEIQKQLEGCEVQSLEYEGTVGIRNGIAYRDGEQIKVSWKKLWKEYTKSEGIDEEIKWLMQGL